MAEQILDPNLLEQRVGQIRGIISARVVPEEGGEIGEIHVMATTQRTAKQLVRDIESLCLLHFKKRIDYRKISIVQLEGNRVSPMGRIRLKLVESEVAPRGQSQKWKVILEFERQELKGQWEGTPSVTEPEGAAMATLCALQELVGVGVPLTLKEAALAHLEGAAVVIASVNFGVPPREEVLLGSSFIKDTVGEASARAVLSALNRRLPFTLE